MPAPRFLIVDDHLLFGRVVANELVGKYPGCHCEVATRLSELKLAELAKTNLVILDLGLGDGDAVSWLESSPAVKILVLSSASEEAVVSRVLGLDINGFVHKADEPACLFQGIEAVLAGGHYLSPHVQRLRNAISRNPEALHKILTPREYEVLRLVSRGLSTAEIAEQTGLRAGSISDHKKNLMTKLGVHSLPELMRCAIERGLARV